MQHKYPFTSLYYEVDPSYIDVNVHPQKLEIRFNNGEDIRDMTIQAIRQVLQATMIPKVSLSQDTSKDKKEDKTTDKLPEPFEVIRREEHINKISQKLKKMK